MTYYDLKIYDLTSYENVLFTGDIHGEISPFIFDVTKRMHFYNSLIIIVGDFGLGFCSKNKDFDDLQRLNDKMKQGNNVVAVIRGNHDEPALYRNDNEWHHKVDVSLPYIKLIPDYSVLQTAAGNILCIGGARSIDRANRDLNYTYWADEMVEKKPYAFFDWYKDSGINIDIICSHTAPSISYPIDSGASSGPLQSWAAYDSTLIDDNYYERDYLTQVVKQLVIKGHDIKTYIYGHFHNHHEMNLYVNDDEGNTHVIASYCLDMFHPTRHYITSDKYTGPNVTYADWLNLNKEIKQIAYNGKKFTYSEFYEKLNGK